MVAIPNMMLKIEREIEDKTIVQQPRPYLGISGIGHHCVRAMWYDFRWVSEKKLTPRQQRLFSRGHREEPIIIKDLRTAGCIVRNQQKGMITGHGHIKGHIDGTVDNVPDAPKTTHLLEIKTANKNRFSKMEKEGVGRSDPSYLAQMQCYMH